MARVLAASSFFAAACAATVAWSPNVTPDAGDQPVLWVAQQEQQQGQGDGISLDRMGHDRGVAVAQNWVAEFLDFGCGYCAKFALETFPTLDKEYVESGKVRWKYVPFVSGMFANSEDAAVAAECAAEQGKFLEMHDSLLASRKEWTRPTGAPAVFNRLAKRLSLNPTAFSRCAGSSNVRDRIRRNTAVARRLQIRGTPTFFINGQKVEGAIPLPLFRQVLDRLRT